MAGRGVDPHGDLLPGAGGAQPELLRPDGHVARRRDDAVHLDRVRPAGRLRGGSRALGGGGRAGQGFQVRGRPQAQPIIRLCWSGAEPGGGSGHVQRLVRPVMVVFAAPGIHCGLGRLDRGERPGVIQEVGLQGLVPALDLAGGGRRVRPGQQLLDPVLAADPLEQHLRGPGLAEPAGEHLAVIGQHLIGDAVKPHRGYERPAHRPAGSPAHHRGDHAEPRAVIQSGDQFQLGAIGQEHRPGDVHLPQLHRLLTLPALVVLAAAFALTGWHQAMAHQHPVDRGPGRQRAHPCLAQLEPQPPRAPPRMRPAQPADQRLDLSIQLPGLKAGPVRVIGQPRRAFPLITTQPAMHSLTGHPIPAGHLGDRRTRYDLHDGVIALLHDAQLHEHGPTTPCRELPHGGTCPGGRCQASGEANVSTISRSQTQ